MANLTLHNINNVYWEKIENVVVLNVVFSVINLNWCNKSLYYNSLTNL